MVYMSECKKCGLIYKNRKSANQKESTFCSRVCMNKMVHTWNDRNRFKWKTATKEQIIEHTREIFEKNVIKDEGCWYWKGKAHHTGYVPMNFNGKQIFAHRVSWVLHRGEIKGKLWVLHKCDNKKCTNPDHLFLGTAKDNTQDKEKKGRGNQAKGEEHINAKLTREKVKEIREKLEIGVTMRRLCKEYNMSHGALFAIKHRKTWKHIS